MAEVHLPRSLLALFPAAEQRATVEAVTVAGVIEQLEERWRGMRDRV